VFSEALCEGWELVEGWRKKRLTMKTTHEFAIYIDQLSSLIASIAPGGQLVIDDKDMYHRITRVLRLRTDEQCVVFDRTIHGSFLIKDFQAKRRVIGQLISKESNQIFSPEIIFMLPLLKREDLDTALYSLVEVGANMVQLVITEKVQRAWRGEKEHARLNRVMIAAAEQSKNFSFPQLQLPISFDQAIQQMNEYASPIVFCDPSGDIPNNVLQTIKEQQPNRLVLMVGPEGDLTVSEKNRLKENEALFCALTPTVLRARQAVALSSGMFRALL